MPVSRFIQTIKKSYRYLNQLSGGTLGILRTAVNSFSRCRGSEAAAGLAFYTLLSLFPLLIVMISIASSFFGTEEAFREAVVIVNKVIPVSQEIIETNLKRVIDLRGPLGLASLVVTSWSAALVFSTLVNNINLAWTQARSRNMFNQRVIGLAIVLMLVLFLFLSLSTTTLAKVLPKYNIPIYEEIPLLNINLWNFGTNLLPWLFSFMLFFVFYYWVPNIDVSRKAAILSAVFVSFLWEITKLGFAWYLGSGLVRYEVVYGSLSAIVVLMLWIYISAMILLFGAHLCAALDNHKFMKAD